jgi:protein-S-isoprenylcysteine O-methyltransferase Ste14
MEPLAKMLIAAGALFIVGGAILFLLAKLHFRGLPGDIVYQNNNTTFYFPIVTCLVLSVLGTVAMWIWRWLFRQ